MIHGVTAVWRAGEQEQTPPEGFESSGAETALGVEVTKAKPVTRTITSANIDRLRVTFGVQSLLETTSKGDRNPSSVRLLIQLQRNGNWVTEKDVTINGKTTSQFLASVILDNLPPRPFNAYSALFDHGLASKSDQRFASIRSTGNLTFSTAF